MTRSVRQHDSFDSFQRTSGSIYWSAPVLFNIELSTLAELAAGPRPGLYLSVHNDDNRAVGAAFRPIAHPLLTSGLDAAGAAAAAQFLAQRGVALPGLLGLRSSAEAFVKTWCDLTGAGTGLYIRETVYRLATLNQPSPTSGASRIAQRGDKPLLIDWLGCFHAETFGQPVTPASTGAFLGQALAGGSQFIVWQVGDVPVSFARVHPAIEGVARLGPVFTHPERRGRGYGAAVTAAAVVAAQSAGAKDVVLHTDVTNTPANAVYRRLGFTPAASSLQATFTPAPAT